MSQECPIPLKRPRMTNSESSVELCDAEIMVNFESFNDFDIFSTSDHNHCLKMANESFKSLYEIQNSDLENIKDKISDSMKWISERRNKKSQYLCRCDAYLDKMIHKSHKTRLEYVRTLMKNLQVHFPNLNSVTEFDISYMACGTPFDIQNYDQALMLKDILDDIRDLQIWIQESNRKMNLMVLNNNEFTNEILQVLKDDLKIHDNIRNAINRIVEEIFTSNCHDNIEGTNNLEIEAMKNELLICEEQFFQLWIRIMEIEEQIKSFGSVYCSNITELSCYNINEENMSSILKGADESGFETELSPQYPWRRRLLPKKPKNNLLEMRIRYISSSTGPDIKDFLSDDLPPDTETSSEGALKELKFDNMDDKKEDLIIQYQNNKRKVLRHRRKRKKNYMMDDNRKLIIDTTRTTMTTTSSDSSIDASNEGNTSRTTIIGQRKLKNTQQQQQQQISDFIVNSPLIDYSEIAEKADKLIQDQHYLKRYTIHLTEEEGKDSRSQRSNEIEEEDEIEKGDIDIEKQWDYYEAPLYSHTSGDSELLDVTEIREWEHELDTNSDLIVSSVDEVNEKREEIYLSQFDSREQYTPDFDEIQPNLQISQLLTSGYDTSPDLDSNHYSNVNFLQLIYNSSYFQLKELNKSLKSLSQINYTQFTNSTASTNLTIATEHIDLIETLIQHVNIQSIQNTIRNDDKIQSIVYKLICLKDEWMNLMNNCRNIINIPPHQTNHKQQHLTNEIEARIMCMSSRVEEAVQKCGWLLMKDEEKNDEKQLILPKKTCVETMDIWIHRLELCEIMLKAYEKDLDLFMKEISFSNSNVNIQELKNRISSYQSMIKRVISNLTIVNKLVVSSNEVLDQYRNMQDEKSSKELCEKQINEIQNQIKIELDNLNKSQEEFLIVHKFMHHCLIHQLQLLIQAAKPVLSSTSSCSSSLFNHQQKANTTIKSTQTNKMDQEESTNSNNSNKFLTRSLKVTAFAFAVTAVLLGLYYNYQGAQYTDLYCRPSYIRNSWMRYCYPAYYNNTLPPH